MTSYHTVTLYNDLLKYPAPFSYHHLGLLKGKLS